MILYSKENCCRSLKKGFFKDQTYLCDYNTSTGAHTTTSFAKTFNGWCVGGGVMIQIPLITNLSTLI